MTSPTEQQYRDDQYARAKARIDDHVFQNALTAKEQEVYRIAFDQAPHSTERPPVSVFSNAGDIARNVLHLARVAGDALREAERLREELAALKAERATVRSYFGVTE